MRSRLHLLLPSVCLAALVVTGVYTPEASAQTSKAKVLKDFKRTYEIPKGRKVLATKYLGKPRNFTRREGLTTVRYHARKVQVDNLFEACGLKVRYTWEVWYKKVGGWHFAQIAIWGHKELNKPTVPMPELSDTLATELMNKRFDVANENQTYKVKADSVKITKKSSKWNFCMPVYELEATVTLAAGEEHKNVLDLWECKVASKMMKKDGKWQANPNECFHNGKKSGCHYETMCTNRGTRSKTKTISWAKASSLIKARLKADANHKTPRVLKFKKVRQENTSRGGLDTWFVVNARLAYPVKESSEATKWQNEDYTYIYDCAVFARLGMHENGSGKWEVDDIECCFGDKAKCRGGSCGDLRKCKLVEKGPVNKVKAARGGSRAAAAPAAGKAKAKKKRGSKLVDCGNPDYKLGNSVRSLLTWSDSAHKSLESGSGDKSANCAKALKYRGSAWCKEPKNQATIKALTATLDLCE